MKKMVSILMLISLLVYGNIHTNDADVQKLSPEEQQQRVQEAIEVLTENYIRGLRFRKNWAVITGAVLGGAAGYSLSKIAPSGDRGKDIQSILGLIFSGGMLGELLAYDRQQKKIDEILEKRTVYDYSFRLSREQGALFEAAYQRNIRIMKLLVDYQPEVLEQVGVWKALTELYFNQKPTAGRVQRLKEMIRNASMPTFDVPVSVQKQISGHVE